IQCERAGTACVIHGGGRERKEDSVDPAVGFILHKKVGDSVTAGESLCTIHYNSEPLAQRAKALLLSSFEVSEAAPARKRPLVRRVITKSGERN
ncbi:MAG TPA: hypothetical protein VK466_09045, partial [Terriglobales bacterium]|nr:hypothetical protein [Terriglobales bacterium]